MNVYFWILLAIAIIILIKSVQHGFRAGFARELSAVISMLAGLFTISLLTSVYQSFEKENLPALAAGILMLAIFGIVYRIVHVLLRSIGFLARLPVISWLDSALGVVSGLLIGFGILYLIEFFLRNYVLR